MEFVLGPIFFRTMHFEEGIKEEAVQGHTHNFDHVTFVVSGGLRVEYSNGTPSQEYHAPKQMGGESVLPAAFLVKKDVYHKLIPLEPNTYACCLFTHRDITTGEVVQKWNGWMKAAN